MSENVNDSGSGSGSGVEAGDSRGTEDDVMLGWEKGRRTCAGCGCGWHTAVYLYYDSHYTRTNCVH